MVDAIGTTRNLNMFFPADLRWDVCLVEEIQENKSVALLRPIDRVHPYPYLYPTFTKLREWVPLSSGRIEPYRRMSTPIRSIVNTREYDLVEVKDEYGKWQIAEVSANIGTSLWILFVDNYFSPEMKDTRRLWMDVESPNLALYRSHAPPTPLCFNINSLVPYQDTYARVVDICGYNLILTEEDSELRTLLSNTFARLLIEIIIDYCQDSESKQSFSKHLSECI